MTRGKQNKRSWRNYLLDRRYQLLYSMPMVVLTLVLFSGLGFVAMRQVEAATKVGIHHLDQSGARVLGDTTATATELLSRQRSIRLGIIGACVASCLALFFFGVVLTHRVAGPLFRLEKKLRKITAGELEPVRDLRRGDQLVELFARFRAATDALREKEQQDVELFRRAIVAAEQEPDLRESEALEALRARLSAKEAGLG
jgi:methyl-accepting chemotaxis protein